MALAAALTTVYGYGQLQYRAGFNAKEQQALLEIAELNEFARAKEQALIAEQAERDKKQYEEFKDAQNTISQLRADVANGRKRLSVAVSKATVCSSQDSTSTGMDNGTTRAELDHEAADRIIRIAADGDRAIRQLNALQDWAETVVEYQNE